MVPISSPLTNMVYLFQFMSYIARSKSVSARPSVRPETMTNAALEAIASSSAKNLGCNVENMNHSSAIVERI